MTILVTGATGHLGRLTIDALLARGADAGELIAAGRSAEKLAAYAERGIRTRQLDFADPASLDLAGIDTVLLVSGPKPGDRARLHANVIDAAKAAGVAKLVYTSAPHVDSADYSLAPDHRATEAYLAESGVPAVVARNNWYTELYAAEVRTAAETGVIAASVGDGRVASAPRADYAEGLAVLLLDDGHLGRTYEFTGDTAWGFDELAAAASELTGRAVVYRAQTPEERAADLAAAGLDAGTVDFVLSVDDTVRRGVLADAEPTLADLIGRPTTPLLEALRAAL